MTARRNRRAGVEDLWRKSDGSPSKLDGTGLRWRARYVDDDNRENTKRFRTKPEAVKHLERVTSSLVQGTHVDAKTAQMTVAEWCALWVEGYKVNRASSVRQARTHISQIDAEFGTMRLAAIRPSAVRAWCSKLKAGGAADSYVYALHSRLRQILDDAVHDGILARNPCSRRTSPGMGKQRLYVATTAQIWALHGAMEEWLRPAVLLGAFAGLRVAEVSALKVDDIDFMRGVIHPVRQWPDVELKTKTARTPIPIPSELSLMLSASVKTWPGEYMVTDGLGGHAAPWTIERTFRVAKTGVGDLPKEFRFHDLRHYFASLLIAHGGDVKVVQARLRHASAKTTLDTYTHLWPDADESTRIAIGGVIAQQMDSSGGATAYPLRTEGGPG